MTGKNFIKLIQSLAHKKYRLKERLFLVEGDKNVMETINSDYKIVRIWATSDFISGNQTVLKVNHLLSEVTHEEIARASLLKNPQNCLAICEIPENKTIPEELPDDLMIFLDGIQDPGNLGTMMRTCDWFGVRKVFCSYDTADMYNPKVIQASMGSFGRIQLYYTSFPEIYPLIQQNQVMIYGTYLDGNALYDELLPKKVIIIFGNEGNGIRKTTEPFITKRLKIPSFNSNSKGPESLNVAVTAGIICAEHRRQHLISAIRNERIM